MSADPPVLLQPGFVPEPELLFVRLRDQVVWDDRMKARRTASFGVAYNYSQMSYPATPMPSELAALAERIAHRLGFRANNCLLNFYADGDAAMGFHSDSATELVDGTGVAILSLGGSRDMAFRPKSNRALETRRTLYPGSLLYMSKAMQDDWLHAIPPAPGAAPRISLTFRQLAAPHA